MKIEEILAERGQHYGDFEDNAMVAQTIKQALREAQGWEFLSYKQAEALEMIAHKMARIVNGDSTYVDSWTDIIGYARLVEQGMLNEQVEEPGEDRKCKTPECAACNPEILAAIVTLRKAGYLVNP